MSEDGTDLREHLMADTDWWSKQDAKRVCMYLYHHPSNQDTFILSHVSSAGAGKGAFRRNIRARIALHQEEKGRCSFACWGKIKSSYPWFPKDLFYLLKLLNIPFHQSAPSSTMTPCVCSSTCDFHFLVYTGFQFAIALKWASLHSKMRLYTSYIVRIEISKKILYLEMDGVYATVVYEYIRN